MFPTGLIDGQNKGGEAATSELGRRYLVLSRNCRHDAGLSHAARDGTAYTGT